MARAARDRLDQPRAPRRLRGPSLDTEAFGQATERLARFLGTGRYLLIQSLIVIVWISFNVAAIKERFDPYPFILLNLAFSTQAAYAAPLILLAQNRQDDRDRANLIEDRDRARRNLEDTEFLARELADIRLALGETVTRDFLRAELRDLIDELERADGRAPVVEAVGIPPKKKKRKRNRVPRAAAAAPESVTEPQRPPEEIEEPETPPVSAESPPG